METNPNDNNSKNTPAITGNGDTQIKTTNPVNSEKLEFGNEIRKMIATGGTLEMTEPQKLAMYAPIKDEEVMVRPDGRVYLSWIKYAKRITDAFGGTGWVMIPEGMPKMSGNLVVWGFHLVIKGVYCGFAIGEQGYYATSRMSYGEACEGAKSNALMRLCKALGIGLELWDEVWTEDWLSKYAETYPDQDKTKYRLKAGAFGKKQLPAVEHSSVQTPAPTQVKTIELHGTGQTNGLTPNVDFVSESKTGKGPKKTTKNAPAKDEKAVTKVETITIAEMADAIKPYYDRILAAETHDQLRMVYDGEVKDLLASGKITEAQKEICRLAANKKFVDITKMVTAAKKK